jgi:beta-phosphoglucomutase-like phosphatase (HAD superfamily)
MAQSLPGLAMSEMAGMAMEECAGRVMGLLCETASRQFPDPRGLLVDYRQIPGVVWREVAGHFGLDPPAADIERMQEAGALDAKNKTRRFEADSARRQAEATEEVRRAARQWVTPWYEQLEQLRGQGLR